MDASPENLKCKLLAPDMDGDGWTDGRTDKGKTICSFHYSMCVRACMHACMRLCVCVGVCVKNVYDREKSIYPCCLVKVFLFACKSFEDPDQTAQMYMLIWAFSLCKFLMVNIKGP